MRVTKVLWLGLALILSPSVDAMTFRTITGTVRTPQGALLSAGTVTFTIRGTVPAGAANGVIAPLSTTCTITTGVLGTCVLASPAYYAVTITPSTGAAWTWPARVSLAEAATATTLQALYLASVTTLTLTPTCVLEGDDLAVMGSDSAPSGQVPVADGSGGIDWTTLPTDVLLQASAPGTAQTGNLNISGTATLGAAAGGDSSLDITGKAGSSGGLVRLTGGQAALPSTDGLGGSVTVNGATGSTGGRVIITGGDGGELNLTAGGPGGNVSVTGGDGASGSGSSGSGGDLALSGGSSGGVGATAGGVTIDAGTPGSGTGASVSIGGTHATEVKLAGGYGSTGVTISSAGAVSADGLVTGSGFSAGASPGMTTTITVRDSAGTGTCTMTFTGGILTATTCSHT